MITVEFGNVTCKVNGVLDEEVNYAIAKRLMCDGKALYSVTNQVTYTGLVPHVVAVLNHYGVQFQLVDRRVKPTPNTKLEIIDGITPRDYQQNVFDHAKSRMVVQMATGAGKTLVLSGMIAEFDVTPVVVLSPKASLAYQLRDEISKFLGRPVGLLTGDTQDVQDITVGTPQMLLKSSILKEAKALLVDECQFLGARTLFSVCREAVNAYYRIAVSATPWRDGNDDLLIEAAINVRNPKSNVSASTLIRKGKLTKCAINFLKIPAVSEQLVGGYDKQYAMGIVDNNYRNDRVMEIIRHERALNHGSILVLFNSVRHGQLLLERIRREFGCTKSTVTLNGETHEVSSVELIDGSTDMMRRNAVLQAAREEKVQILLGSTIADEGLDCPALKVLILAGAGKSSTRAFQRVGRVLRLFAGRETAYIWDMCDESMPFYQHYLYRRALYETEPEWAKNIHVVDRVDAGATTAIAPMAA